MRLLITTQAIDTEDPYLSFFTGWVAEFAKHFEQISVICLKKGTNDLPPTIAVYSLGKEKESGPRFLRRIRYSARLMSCAWRLRDQYDAVLVHQNQEHILVCGILWKILGKKVYLWRNHYAGSVLTDLAAALCTKVFCTSMFSYTAKYKKTVLMPVGVDIALYGPIPGVDRVARSILFYARFAPSKRPDMFVEALGIVRAQKEDFRASIFGSPLAKDTEYVETVKKRTHELGLDSVVRFESGKPHTEGPSIFSAHEVYIDLGSSGMYNKTLFEAAACECLVLTCSKDFAKNVDPMFVFSENDVADLAAKIEALLALSEEEKQKKIQDLIRVAQANSLESLGNRLQEEMH